MFLREALRQCGEVHEEIAGVYAELAVQHTHHRELSARWSEMADRERRRARLLQVLVAGQDALGEDGPFLVQSTPELQALRKIVEEVGARVRRSIDPAGAVECVESIEAAGRPAIYAYFLELARPELARVLRTVDAESARPRAGEPELARLRRVAAAASAA